MAPARRRGRAGAAVGGIPLPAETAAPPAPVNNTQDTHNADSDEEQADFLYLGLIY